MKLNYHNGEQKTPPTFVYNRVSGACAALAVLILGFVPLLARAQSADELRELRELVAQQQAQIQALAEKVQALEEGREASTPLAARQITVEDEDLGNWTEASLGGTEPPRDEVPMVAVLAQDLTTSPDGFKVSLGAHLNRAVNIADDGNRTKAYFVDNGNVPTLAYLKAAAPVSENWELGAHVEVGLQENTALAVSQDNESAGFTTSGRVFELTANSDRYGKFWFGKGFSSAFALVEIDKSGTYGPNLVSVGNTAAGLKYYDTDTDSLSDVSVGEVFVDIEGVNLLNRVRYDTPAWNGFRLGGNLGENQYGAASLRWSRTVGATDLFLVGSAQTNPQGGRIDKRFDAGFSLWHKPSGLNFLIGGARNEFKDTDADDTDGYTIRAGLRRNWFAIGETKTAADYSTVEDIVLNGDKGKSAGAFFVQEVNDWHTEIYTGYRWYDYDRGFGDLDDIHVFSIGARYQFDMTAQPLEQ